MKRRAIIVVAVFVVLSLGAMAAAGKLGGKKTDGPKAVPVVRGTLVDKALAVGTIEPGARAAASPSLPASFRNAFPRSATSSKRGSRLLKSHPTPPRPELLNRRG